MCQCEQVFNTKETGIEDFLFFSSAFLSGQVCFSFSPAWSHGGWVWVGWGEGGEEGGGGKATG